MRALHFSLVLVCIVLASCADLEHMLKHITTQSYFHDLTTEEQVLLIEMAAEGEMGRLPAYIHKVGTQTLRDLIHKLPAHEGQLFEHYVQNHVHHGHASPHPTDMPTTTTAM